MSFIIMVPLHLPLLLSKLYCHCKSFSPKSMFRSILFLNKRPCIEYQIKRCSAPCINKITKDDYCQSVKQARNTLLGRNKEVKEQLLFTMRKCSSEENYELAAIYRDRVKFLEQIQIQHTDFLLKRCRFLQYCTWRGSSMY